MLSCKEQSLYIANIKKVVYPMTEPELFNCPVEASLSIIGGKYKAIILWHLIGQPLRFSELKRFLPQATPKMLTQQLRELEKDDILHREVYPVVPPHTEYSLTDFGRTLIPIIEAMCAWGETHMRSRIKK